MSELSQGSILDVNLSLQSIISDKIVKRTENDTKSFYFVPKIWDLKTATKINPFCDKSKILILQQDLLRVIYKYY